MIVMIAAVAVPLLLGLAPSITSPAVTVRVVFSHDASSGARRLEE
jgi:hypothetical protein